jgi:hypothetical protein
VGKEASQAKDWAGDKLNQAGQGLSHAKDIAADAIAHPEQTLNKAEDWASQKGHQVGEGISKAEDAVATGASNMYQGAKSQFTNAAKTMSSGASDAWKSLKGTGSDIGHFFGL